MTRWGIPREPVVHADRIEIHLTNGMVATIDLVDREVAALQWYVKHSRGKYYAARSVPSTTGRLRQKSEFLHRRVAERAGIGVDGTLLDHRDGDALNCRRSNLRAATVVQNNRNARRRVDNTSGYKGVSWNGRRRLWIAKLGRSRYLGGFGTREAAAAAYNKAAVVEYGEFARLNEVSP